MTYFDGVSRWHGYDTTPWYRCEQPERPTDPVVRWHYAIGEDCEGCRMGARILLAQLPNDSHVQWLAEQLGVTS